MPSAMNVSKRMKRLVTEKTMVVAQSLRWMTTKKVVMKVVTKNRKKIHSTHTSLLSGILAIATSNLALEIILHLFRIQNFWMVAHKLNNLLMVHSLHMNKLHSLLLVVLAMTRLLNNQQKSNQRKVRLMLNPLQQKNFNLTLDCTAAFRVHDK